MEDVNGKKKKFSFLGSLGMGNNTNTPPATPDPTPPPKPEKNAFYVGNVQDELKKKKKLLEEIE